MGNAVDVVQLNHLIGKEMKTPSEKTFRRIAAAQRNKLGLQVKLPENLFDGTPATEVDRFNRLGNLDTACLIHRLVVSITMGMAVWLLYSFIQ
ncbi:hypothetical protein CSA37_06060 [Candidatus Fermentibacteria bacterium]|nr:MAG: hypothetical protein CSA37_06060 [Candidatus Fermentibacteria bacterium]